MFEDAILVHFLQLSVNCIRMRAVADVGVVVVVVVSVVVIVNVVNVLDLFKAI